MCDHYDSYHGKKAIVIQKRYRVKPQFEDAVIELRSHFTVTIKSTPIEILEDEDIGKHLKKLGLFELFCEEIQDTLVDERFAIKLNIRNFLVFMTGYSGDITIHRIYKHFSESFPEINFFEKCLKRDHPEILIAKVTGITEVSQSDFNTFKCR